MTRAFKILTFQAAALVAGAFMMSTVVGDQPRPRRRRLRPPCSIGNFTFKDPVVTVKPGTTVTWTNGDDIPHTVVSKDGAFKSKVLDTGDRFSFTFAKPGQFGYFCSLHPHMTGTIIVKA